LDAAHAPIAGIVHTLEKEPRRRRREASRFGRLRAAASDFHEDAHNPAHHFPQKVRAFDDDEDEIAVFVNVEPLHEHDRRGVFLIGIAGRESPEVAHADETARPIAHAVQVERFLDPPHVRFGERRAPA